MAKSGSKLFTKKVNIIISVVFFLIAAMLIGYYIKFNKTLVLVNE